MRGLDKQQTLLLLAAALLAAGIGAFRYMPLLRQRQALDATLEANRRTLEEIQTQRLRLDDLAQTLAQMQEQAAAFDAQIPAGRSFADLWRQIADEMNACALGEQLVQPGQPVEADGIGTIPLTLACSGSLRDIYAFLQAIEQWDRLIRFEQIELTNDSGLGGQVKLSGKAQLYYQPQQRQG